jgi:hypothetical protein
MYLSHGHIEFREQRKQKGKDNTLIFVCMYMFVDHGKTTPSSCNIVSIYKFGRVINLIQIH